VVATQSKTEVKHVKKALALALGLALSYAANSAAQVTAIKAGRLVDPQAGTVLSDQIILIRDNKIEQVGKGLAIPADAKVIDLSK
jgi:imidazolonepropionase-like amidohydrolase